MKIKKLHISIGFLVLILSLTVAGTMNQSFTPQYKLETPKSSDGEITIVTPENKTYTEPMSGYYPATFGFENDLMGTMPTSWTYDPGGSSGGTVGTVNSENNHQKVVRITQISGAVGIGINNIFSGQNTGTIELWACTSVANKPSDPLILADSVNYLVQIKFNYGQLIYSDGASDYDIMPYSANQWYHFRIDFNSSSDTYDLYIDDELKVNQANYRVAGTDIVRLQMATYPTSPNQLYLDAIGYSWDPDYEIGNNQKEGLLLSYENTTTLDWKGFSLDGQANKTIMGNTTIPMPVDGLHTIQVFGNDTMGTMYGSDVRYFTVNTAPPEVTINSPAPSQTIGTTAPSYDISITGPYDSIWYTFDGGTTNITASSLTGTINQAAWTALADGIITIRFFANNSAGMEGSAQVMVIKDSSEESPPIPPGIPGYSLIALIGVTLAVSLILAKRKLKK